jgi:hypothetical protein
MNLEERRPELVPRAVDIENLRGERPRLATQPRRGAHEADDRWWLGRRLRGRGRSQPIQPGRHPPPAPLLDEFDRLPGVSASSSPAKPSCTASGHRGGFGLLAGACGRTGSICRPPLPWQSGDRVGHSGCPARAAGLPRIRLHDERHSYATAALKAGISAKVISERLGHASVAFTLQTYGRDRCRPHPQQHAEGARNRGPRPLR